MDFTWVVAYICLNKPSCTLCISNLRACQHFEKIKIKSIMAKCNKHLKTIVASNSLQENSVTSILESKIDDTTKRFSYLKSHQNLISLQNNHFLKPHH